MSNGRLGFLTSTSVAPKPERIAADLERLKGFTLPDQPFTRRAFTEPYLEERRWLCQRMREAGLHPKLDAAANLVGTRPSRRVTKPPLMLGSHTDTVAGGGLYDGIAGVVAALEAATILDKAGVELPFDLLVVDFLCEEPSDFGLSCIGSRAMVGELTARDLARVDPAGRTLASVIRDAGGDPEHLSLAVRRPGEIRAFMELHIEQGPTLEESRRQIGIVSAIAGIRRHAIAIAGERGHAGTTPMGKRKDALAAAAEIVLAVEAIALDPTAGGFVVATVGSIAVTPGAANVVPGAARLLVEARAPEESWLDAFDAELKARAHTIATRRALTIAVTEQSRSQSVPMDAGLQSVLARTTVALGAPFMTLPSRASHDAAHLATIAPTAMIFIPCRGGVSHTPAEHADLEDIVTGVRVLVGVIDALAAEAA